MNENNLEIKYVMKQNIIKECDSEKKIIIRYAIAIIYLYIICSMKISDAS